ncbi:hypothetical protein EVAR_100016_1 [Eumeta japonica]|uniref:Uncharacterized protein n=1 Tax=Eumeta variegata TaxID=151549 RepID=A0A4C1ZQE7_EUMVA|nr:hypothetical protein EVAR_100016_1 [Eumeta japonica]
MYSYGQRSQAFEGLSCIFDQPSSPHWGGLYEAPVRSAKTHLRRVIREEKLTFKQLSAFFVKLRYPILFEILLGHSISCFTDLIHSSFNNDLGIQFVNDDKEAYKYLAAARRTVIYEADRRGPVLDIFLARTNRLETAEGIFQSCSRFQLRIDAELDPPLNIAAVGNRSASNNSKDFALS